MDKNTISPIIRNRILTWIPNTEKGEGDSNNNNNDNNNDKQIFVCIIIKRITFLIIYV